MTSDPRTARRVARTAGLSLVPGLVLALAPKCPFCIAAYLSALGIGAGTASLVAPWLRPVALALLALIASATAYGWWRRRRTDA